MLDTEGRLVYLRSVPPQMQSTTGTLPPPDWTIFFAEAGFDVSQWTPTDAKWSPLSYADSRAAWQGSLQNRPGIPIRIEAAAFQGKPVNFEIIGPWSRAVQMESVQSRTSDFINAIGVLLAFATIVGGIIFARRNLRLGRGDRRNATRLALIFWGLWILARIIQMPRVSFITLFLNPPYAAVLLWVFYMAIEPFVRRRWPQVLLSWTRLLSGEWRDPLVARDILLGFAFGVLLACTGICGAFLPSRPFVGLNRPTAFNLEYIIGALFIIAGLLQGISNNISFGLALIFLLIIMRVLLRNQKLLLLGASS